ncbi:RNA recognition motif. (a.k.a. RRM RBD or RNP domain)/RNA recognition motif (a.k.a. RRM RBD or RNP domain) [Leishmania donovani]|uniref:RNA recognition motif family protein n=1 Tax=Leishmania donovani TaxID=5661 RepID=A0A504Y3E4_LEIDO|nr:RNA recognition motif family protein [Leishmania donovani]CAJ1992136.1 RNA recognition motif. (a.k.a. RRM RBD or RNP domain)/RNA recognition motif (a.k.a. RRM RBD or RNP domain) [Leishmania donovani]VDZ47973.1 RNA_recognition_motif._(a.k.a._RRM_RBD_or_RNP_domain)/RNA_recognition_motif_(a.k.a._RRM_RBD_or_RNP_domain)_putative/Pfam:PF00076/Pfam:PF14259/Pfam:PF13893 [Leishmania donovani]
MAQLFVGQLPFSKFFPDDLLDLFRPYGNVIAHQLHIHQGNAFVTYPTTDEADRAIQALHSKCSLGTRSQPIQVMYSKGTRLISAFGLHHRSVCLSRNKDRQRSKEASATAGGATDDDALLNEVSNLNSSSSKNVILTPLMCTAGGAGGSEEPNTSFTTLFSSYGDLSGKSEISGEEDGRQPNGVHGAVASSNAFLQQQKPPSYPVGADPLVYSSAMGWQIARQSLVASTATTPLTSVISNGATTPMSDLINPSAPAPAPTPVTYVMMPNSGNSMPCVMPLYYALPASTSAAIAQQQQRQQQALASALASYNARAAPVQIAYLPITPQ